MRLIWTELSLLVAMSLLTCSAVFTRSCLHGSSDGGGRTGQMRWDGWDRVDETGQRSWDRTEEMGQNRGDGTVQRRWDRVDGTVQKR